jgi:hypothetical protein
VWLVDFDQALGQGMLHLSPATDGSTPGEPIRVTSVPERASGAGPQLEQREDHLPR